MMKRTLTLGIGVLIMSTLVGCSQQDTINNGNSNSIEQAETNTSQVVSSNSSNDSNNSTNPTNATNDSSNQVNNKISDTLNVTLDEAIKIYQEKYPNSDITSLELDTSFGKFFYKIDGVDNTYEYELKIDGETKALSEERKEILDTDEQNGLKRAQDKLNLTDLISIDKASEIAEKQVGSGQATDWDLDKEMNITYWEVKVRNGNQDTKVKINAQTGEVLESEIDD